MHDTVNLAQTLIQRPSVTPDDGGCQLLIEERLDSLGFRAKNYSAEGVSNTYYKLDRGGPLFWFVGHTDVVPTGPESSWDSPPFSGEIIDDTLFGRGSADMKGSIAAMIVAIEQYLEQSPKSSLSIGLIITSDEEGPAQHGVKHVANCFKAIDEIPTWTVVGEPSSSKTLGDTIKIGRRGSLNAQITIHGKQGHIAYPHLANNPIHLAMPALDALCKTIWDEGNAHFPPTSFQIANMQSGTGASNVIPADVHVQANFRFNTEQSAQGLKDKTEAILSEYCEDFHIDWQLSGDPFLTEPGILVNTMQASITEVLNLQADLSTSGGTSDGRFIAPLGGELIEFGPINKTIHQINECVSCTDLINLTEIYKRLLQKLSDHAGM